jgi:hypothetical protein
MKQWNDLDNWDIFDWDFDIGLPAQFFIDAVSIFVPLTKKSVHDPVQNQTMFNSGAQKQSIHE